MIRRCFIAGAFVLALFTQAGPSNAADRSRVPIELNAILSTTGVAAFLGSREAETLKVLEKYVNDNGGVSGKPIHFVIQDDASIPQNTVQLVNGLSGKKINGFIGPVLAATCAAVQPLADKDGPVSYCLSPVVRPSAGSYVFSANVGTPDYMPATMKYLKAHGLTRIALLMTSDASGKDYETYVDEAMARPEGTGMQIVAREHFAASDLSVAAQMSRIKAASPQVLLTFSVGLPFATALHAYNDAGMTIPVFGSGANMSHAQLNQYRSFAPKLIFVAGAGAALDPVPGKLRDAQTIYFKAFETAHMQPEYLNTFAWDPGLLLIDAVRHVGVDAPAQKLRDYISQLRTFQGVTGNYDFLKYPQRGLGSNSAVLYQWDPANGSLTVLPN